MFSNFSEPEDGWADISDFGITLAAGLISLVANLLMNELTWDFFYKSCKEKNDEQLRIAKTKKSCNSFYKGVYYIAVAIWGYEVLKDEIYLPRSLLGSGDLLLINKGYPNYKMPEGLKYYYLGTLGYHVH